MAETPATIPSEYVTRAEYDTVVKQLNNLQSVFIELKNNFDNLNKNVVPIVQDITNWHEHTMSGLVVFNKVPEQIKQAQISREKQKIIAEYEAQKGKPAPQQPIPAKT